MDADAPNNNLKIYLGDNLVLDNSMTWSGLEASNNNYILLIGKDSGGNYYQGELDSLFISDILM